MANHRDTFNLPDNVKAVLKTFGVGSTMGRTEFFNITLRMLMGQGTDLRPSN
jgi:hypothetical protein